MITFIGVSIYEHVWFIVEAGNGNIANIITFNTVLKPWFVKYEYKHLKQCHAAKTGFLTLTNHFWKP